MRQVRAHARTAHDRAGRRLLRDVSSSAVLPIPGSLRISSKAPGATSGRGRHLHTAVTPHAFGVVYGD
jgi:hypothetical protein